MKVVRKAEHLVDIKDVPAGTLFEYKNQVYIRAQTSVNTDYKQPLNAVAVQLETGRTFAVMYVGHYDPIMVKPLEGEVVIK